MKFYSADLGPTLSHDGKFPRFSAEQERALVVRKEAGDEDARTELALSMIPWGLELFRRYRRYHPRHEAELIGCIMEGVLIAVDEIDSRRDRRLSTVVRIWAKNRVQRARRHEWNLIRVPSYLVDAMIAEQKGRPYSPEFTAFARLEDARRANSAAAVGLGGWEGQQPDALERVEDHRGGAGDEDESPALGRVREALDSLNERNSLVIRLRFGLVESLGPYDPGRMAELREALDKLHRTRTPWEKVIRLHPDRVEFLGPLSHPQIGAILGVTRSRVQQIEKKTMAKLGRMLGAA